MATLSEAQAAQAEALTAAQKAQANREAAKIAALMGLYYQRQVDPSSQASVDRWLDLLIPRLIDASDSGARAAANYYQTLRRLEVPRERPGNVEIALGKIDEGVRRSLLQVGPYSYMNKMADIPGDAKPSEVRALQADALRSTTAAVISSTIRHAQAGARQTLYQNSERDKVALGWVRVTSDNPCFFCAALASRGLRYRPFNEDSFAESNLRFDGDGDAKVHDNCGCTLKPVFARNDPLVAKTDVYSDLWERWGAGGASKVAPFLRFRRGYEHYQRTGEYLDFDTVDTPRS